MHPDRGGAYHQAEIRLKLGRKKIGHMGCMGVPITALDKIDTNTWELLDCIRPKINGKALFQRIIIRKKLPTEIEEYINKGGVVFQADEDLLIPIRQERE